MSYSQPTGQSANETSNYFVARQILLLVEHNDPRPSAEQIDELIRYSNEAAGTADITRPRQILSFPRSKKRGPFSLVFADVTESTGPRDLLTLLERLESQFGQPRNGLTLRTVSPNWLGTGAPQTITGGPGARPLRAPALERAWWQSRVDDLGTPYGFTLWSLPPQRQVRAEIDVAILDTVPDRHALVRAYNTWHEEHPVIRSLLRPGGPLETVYAPYQDLLRLTNYHAEDVASMGDHGLFVAGIIHSIAPHARLQLIEVLNRDGTGDLETIAGALHGLVERKRTRPLVINCSLVMNIPTLDQLETLPADDPLRSWLNAEKLQSLRWPLEWIFDVLHDQGAFIVAAAGNDATPENPNPEPRYPAAFENVLGVAALEEGKQIRAGYSNVADTKAWTGIATFGGAAKDGVALAEEGILGAFIGPFPNNVWNTSGWAWWAGTSFAAPIISGAIAALLAEGATSAEALQKLREAERGSTSDNTEVFSVTQGNVHLAPPLAVG